MSRLSKSVELDKRKWVRSDGVCYDLFTMRIDEQKWFWIAVFIMAEYVATHSYWWRKAQWWIRNCSTSQPAGHHWRQRIFGRWRYSYEQMQSSYGNPLIFKRSEKWFSCLVAWSIFSNLSVAQIYAMLEVVEVQSIIGDTDTADFLGYGLYKHWLTLCFWAQALADSNMKDFGLFCLEDDAFLYHLLQGALIQHGFFWLSRGSLSTTRGCRYNFYTDYTHDIRIDCNIASPLVQTTTSMDSASYIISAWSGRKEHSISVALTQLTGSVAGIWGVRQRVWQDLFQIRAHHKLHRRRGRQQQFRELSLQPNFHVCKARVHQWRMHQFHVWDVGPNLAQKWLAKYNAFPRLLLRNPKKAPWKTYPWMRLRLATRTTAVKRKHPWLMVRLRWKAKTRCYTRCIRASLAILTSSKRTQGAR